MLEKKTDKRVTKAQQIFSLDDAVSTFKSQISVLKEYIFVKRVVKRMLITNIKLSYPIVIY